MHTVTDQPSSSESLTTGARRNRLRFRREINKAMAEITNAPAIHQATQSDVWASAAGAAAWIMLVRKKAPRFELMPTPLAQRVSPRCRRTDPEFEARHP